MGLPLAALTILTGLTACSPIKVEAAADAELEGDLNARLDGEVNVNARAVFEGPIPIRPEDGALPVRLTGPMEVTVNIQGAGVRYEGTNISDELLERVKVGETTDDWVLAVFGEPTARATLRDGTEIWRWTYRPVTQEGALVEVFGGGDKDPKLATRAVFLQIRANLVIQKWRG